MIKNINRVEKVLESAGCKINSKFKSAIDRCAEEMGDEDWSNGDILMYITDYAMLGSDKEFSKEFHRQAMQHALNSTQKQ